MNSIRYDLPIVLTGATGAIGSEIARALVSEGRKLILACRNEKKCATLIDSLHRDFPDADLRYLHLDLADSKSVNEAIKQLAGTELLGLINNAGIMCRHYSLSADNRETTLTVNYHNTKLLTEGLLPNIDRYGFIVFTTSLTRFMWRKRNLPEDVTERQFGQLKTYALSKRLITNYAIELNARNESPLFRINCADPGIVDTEMIRMDRWFDRLADKVFRPLIRRPAEGAQSALRAANAPIGGLIYCRKTELYLK